MYFVYFIQSNFKQLWVSAISYIYLIMSFPLHYLPLVLIWTWFLLWTTAAVAVALRVTAATAIRIRAGIIRWRVWSTVWWTVVRAVVTIYHFSAFLFCWYFTIPIAVVIKVLVKQGSNLITICGSHDLTQMGWLDLRVTMAS